MPRAGFLASVVLAASLLAWSAAAGAAVRPLQAPSAADIARGAAIADTTLSPTVARTVARAGFWGGPTVAATGETVNVFVSDTYPQDPAIAQKWANFIAALIHGSEIAQLDAYLMPLAEVQRYCGRNALACYSPSASMLVAPGEDPASDTTAEAIVAHEYGHHVATYRDNAPWDAIDYGTKRWASYENVCARTAAGELHPGDESQEYYEYNPGEAFAETYRVLNERSLGLTETPWDIVTQSLYPDDTALELVRQDVLQPWTTTTSNAYKGIAGRKFSFATTLDGTLRITLGGNRKARYRLDVNSGTQRLASFTTAAGRSKTATVEVCGERNLTVNVRRLTKTGTFALRVSKP